MTTADFSATEQNIAIEQGDDFTYPITWIDNTKTVTDAVTVAGQPGVSSAKGLFLIGDVGDPIVGPNIPYGTTIAAFTSANQISMSENASDSGTAEARWGLPVDTSSWVFSGEIRGRADYPGVLARFTFAQPRTSLTLVQLTTEETGALPVGPLAYEIHAVISGLRRTLYAGTFRVKDA